MAKVELRREEVHGRTRVKKRIAGRSMGPSPWKEALAPGIATEVILTDRENGVPRFLERAHPEVRRGLCECQLGRTLNQRRYLRWRRLNRALLRIAAG